MWLHPPVLGRLHVNLRMHDDRVTIDVRTETETARQRVSLRADELRDALLRHGIEVERFAVVREDGPASPAGVEGNSAEGSAFGADPSDEHGRHDAARNAASLRRGGAVEQHTDTRSEDSEPFVHDDAVAETRLDIRV
jgi:flagellar hook-length control protein FliK